MKFNMTQTHKDHDETNQLSRMLKNAQIGDDKKIKILNLKALKLKLKRALKFEESTSELLKINPEISTQISSDQENPHKMMSNVSEDYRKKIQQKEQQLITLKEERISIFDKIEDVTYELEQNKKILKYLLDKLDDRELQKQKLFSEINKRKLRQKTTPAFSTSGAMTPRLNNSSNFFDKIPLWTTRNRQNSKPEASQLSQHSFTLESVRRKN